MMAEAPLTSYSTNSYSSMSKINFPITSPTEEKLTTFISDWNIYSFAGDSIGSSDCHYHWYIYGLDKSTKHSQDTEQQDGSYATLTREEQLDVTSNHPTDVIYEVLGESKTITCIAYGKTMKEGQMNEA